MADPVLLLTIFIITVALVFDYVNGFHDAANSIATVVSTRVLTPMQGVVWAAFWNFIAAFTFGTAVAKTIGSGLLDVGQVDSYVILAALIGAIAWDLITWYVGLPTSSSHALIGGYAGAGIAKAGLGIIIPGGWIMTLIFIILAPLLGMALGMINLVAILNIFKHSSPSSVDHIFRRGQLISAAAYSLGHGTNDAQKTMGIIAGALFIVPEYREYVSDAAGKLFIPFWIVLMAHAAIGLGTLSGGLAHRPHHGIADYQASTDRRIRRRSGRRAHAIRRGPFRHSRVHDPHHHRRDYRRRLPAPAPLGALERRRPNHLGMGSHHPCVSCNGHDLLVTDRLRSQAFLVLH